jgi:AraC-like DNA-binding protein
VYVNDGAYRDLEELHEPTRGGRSRNSRYRLCETSVKYVELLEEVKLRQDLYIDEESFMRYVKLGKRVKVLRRRVPQPTDGVVKEIVKVMSKYPRLCSRTDRAKYALAKVAYAVATGSSIDIAKLSEELGLSRTHVKRLIKVIYSSSRFIDEVRRLVNSQVVLTYAR